MREIRALQGLEVRAAEDGRQTLIGYAAVFNSPSEDLGGFVETIQPGAFRRSLQDRQDVYALADHDPARRLGRTKNGSLRLAEDERGLRVEIDLPDTTLGRDVQEEIRTGLLDAMSFGFTTQADAWDHRDGKTTRTLIDVDLFEVSAVAFPAYRATTIDVAKRSLERWQSSQSPTFKPTVFRLRKLKQIRDFA